MAYFVAFYQAGVQLLDLQLLKTLGVDQVGFVIGLHKKLSFVVVLLNH